MFVVVLIVTCVFIPLEGAGGNHIFCFFVSIFSCGSIPFYYISSWVVGECLWSSYLLLGRKYWSVSCVFLTCYYFEVGV